MQINKFLAGTAIVMGLSGAYVTQAKPEQALANEPGYFPSNCQSANQLCSRNSSLPICTSVSQPGVQLLASDCSTLLYKAQ